MSRAIFRVLSLFAILAWAAALPAEVTRPKTDLRLPKPEGKDAGSGKDKEEKDGDQEADDEEQPRPEMGKPGEDEHEAMHDRLEAEGRKNLKEISRLMDKVRNDLSKKQTGTPTQSDEREVTKKIQDLIEKLQNGCKSCSSSSSDDQQQAQKKSGKKKDQSGSKRSENEKQSVKQDQKPSSSKDKEPKGGGKVENDRRELGKPPPSGAASLQEKAEQLAKWGILPKRMVEQMQSGNGKEYPAEYKEIITKYYEKLSKLSEETSGR